MLKRLATLPADLSRVSSHAVNGSTTTGTTAGLGSLTAELAL